MSHLQNSHQQSLTITLPSAPSLSSLFSSSSASSNTSANTLKFTFPQHPSITHLDDEVNDLRTSLDPKTIPNTHTILTLPPKSTFSTGLHWHETHEEYLFVLQGKALITVEDVTRVIGREDGVQEVKRGVIHGFSRADSPALSRQRLHEIQQQQQQRNGDDSWMSEDVIVLEFTSPADPLKEVMFRNGVSAFLANDSQLSLPLIARILVNMGTLDQYPLIIPAGVPGSIFLSWAMVHALFGISVPVLKWWGFRGWEREWTPEELWEVAEENEGGKGRKEL